ncbi:hypothetical protein MKY37_18740 [Psychrobacillus sp. FSL K6-2836]|uniref:type II secretion system protein n=1 Tax=Psychrobacillus sp. FSL K6-2836 TaxID=2921548 RepID=UPI0030FAD44F
MTLLELLATIAILGIFITIIFSVVTTTFNQNDKTLSHINLRQEANLIITNIRNQHQGKVIICEKDILEYETQSFVINIENFAKNKECSNPEEDLFIKFTLADYENNEYTIDTIIEKIQVINPENPDPEPEPEPSDSFYDFLTKENVFIYGSKYAFSGNSTDGPNGKMIILGDINSSELNGGSLSNVSNIEVQGSVILDGGSAGMGSKTSPGTIIIQGSFTSWSGTRQIYGDIYVNGDFRIKDAHINGNIFVDGNVEIGWTPQISKDSLVYYTGTITFPKDMSKSITDKFIKSDTVPKKTLSNTINPSLKTKEWFSENGYTSSLEDRVNNKIYVKDFNYQWNGWQPSGDIFQNLVIVSENDISLTNVWNQTMTGVLYAPNGKVTFNGSNFEGVIISKDGVFITSGGTNVKLKNIAEYFPYKESAPFY